MNIDKSKLKMGIWYEDDNSNVIPHTDQVDPPKNAHTYHTRFPMELSEDIYAYYDNKDTCRHPLKYRKRTHGWIKGIKDCECTSCGKTKIGKSYIPFIFMPWNYGKSSYKLGRSRVNIGGANGNLIVAMVNSGEYTLSEALTVYASACERCSNVLAHKYTNGAEGYEEYSEEWKKCGTVCDFCRDMGYTNRK